MVAAERVFHLGVFNPALGGNYLNLKYFTKETPPSIVFYGTKDRLGEIGPELVVQAKKVGFSAEVYTAEDRLNLDERLAMERSFEDFYGVYLASASHLGASD